MRLKVWNFLKQVKLRNSEAQAKESSAGFLYSHSHTACAVSCDLRHLDHWVDLSEWWLMQADPNVSVDAWPHMSSSQELSWDNSPPLIGLDIKVVSCKRHFSMKYWAGVGQCTKITGTWRDPFSYCGEMIEFQMNAFFFSRSAEKCWQNLVRINLERCSWSCWIPIQLFSTLLLATSFIQVLPSQAQIPSGTIQLFYWKGPMSKFVPESKRQVGIADTFGIISESSHFRQSGCTQFRSNYHKPM